MTKTQGTKEWATRNVNFSKGCSNNCQYCYAAAMAYRFQRIKSRDQWQEMTNIEEMANKKFKKISGWIMSPSSHDITEDNLELAIKVFKNILNAGNKLLIVTKPRFNCIKKICEELQGFCKGQILFRFTIGTLDDKIRKYWEPGAPSIAERISSLVYAYFNDYKTSVSIEPFLDDYVYELVDTLLPYVTDEIWIGPMNLTHVPAHLITPALKYMYSKVNLLKIKKDIDYLPFTNIKYKDHFLNRIQDQDNFYRTNKSEGSVKTLLTDFVED
ncbi:MAG: hypothetical protein ACTSRR_09785 [Candidatus Heimdallarchaeaceae archaeon]